MKVQLTDLSTPPVIMCDSIKILNCSTSPLPHKKTWPQIKATSPCLWVQQQRFETNKPSNDDDPIRRNSHPYLPFNESPLTLAIIAVNGSFARINYRTLRRPTQLGSESENLLPNVKHLNLQFVVVCKCIAVGIPVHRLSAHLLSSSTPHRQTVQTSGAFHALLPPITSSSYSDESKRSRFKSFRSLFLFAHK